MALFPSATATQEEYRALREEVINRLKDRVGSPTLGFRTLVMDVIKSFENDLEDEETQSVDTEWIANTIVAFGEANGFLDIRWADGNEFPSWVQLKKDEDREKIGNLTSELTRSNLLRSQLTDQVKTLNDRVKEAEEAQKRLQTLYEKATGRVVEVILKEGKRVVQRVKDHYHEQFGDILTLAKARKNIFIYGPTGCGKTYVASQAARALNLPFSFVSCSSGMGESTLTGRLLPIGQGGKFEHIMSEYHKCYENGGIFLFDEFDAIDQNAALVVNASLSGDLLSVPSRVKNPYAKRHPNFICIAAANTVGLGADRLYRGRNPLDAATLDRFAIGKVFMDYDPLVEEKLCPDNDLRNTLQRYRKAIRVHNMERHVSTRFMQDAYEMVNEHKWKFERVEAALFQGWRAEEVKKVRDFTGTIA